MAKSIVISFLSSTLDGGTNDKRRTKWRPNAGIALASEPQIDRLILLYELRDEALAIQVRDDAKQMRKDFDVQLMEASPSSSNLGSTYMTVLSLGERLQFDPDYQYYLNITTCTNLQQICFCSLAESGRWPVKLVQCLDAKASNLASTIHIIDLDLSRYDVILNQYPMVSAVGTDHLKSGIATRDNYYNQMIESIQNVALRSLSPILLRGPAGTGKTALARRLHRVRTQTTLISGRWVEVNCAALKDASAMSTLFGDKDGALLGLPGSWKGELKFGDKGMVFLDNIDELGMPEQAMLLQTLEDKSFTPLGSRTSVKCDFQLIAATNKDLKQRVRDGLFRPELLARLSTWNFRMPSLRERLEDIQPNLEYELLKSKNPLPQVHKFSAKALKVYLTFTMSQEAAWPENFRELSASVERMITLSDNGIISEDVVKREIITLRAQWSSLGSQDVDEDGLNAGLTKSTASSSDVYVTKLLPDHTLNRFELNQLDYVIGMALNCGSYAELSRRLYGEQVGTNAAQKSRSYLIGYGLTLEQIRNNFLP